MIETAGQPGGSEAFGHAAQIVARVFYGSAWAIKSFLARLRKSTGGLREESRHRHGAAWHAPPRLILKTEAICNHVALGFVNFDRNVFVRLRSDGLAGVDFGPVKGVKREIEEVLQR